MLGHRIGGTAGGSSLPAPTAKGNMLAPSMQKWAAHRNLWPTPAARDFRFPNRADKEGKDHRGKTTKGKQLPNAVGGPLNPAWVEWLMGWPLGFTALEPLATDKFRQWLHSHSRS
jgi:hypothetical protein